jgi:hypothetical protein
MPRNNNKANKTKKPNGRGGLRHLPLVAAPPQSRRVLVSYASAISQVEAAVSTGNAYFWRLNSIYDPDSSGVGSSAIGFSYWLNFYQNYKVHRVTVRIQSQMYGMSTGGIGTLVVAPVANQSAVPVGPYTWRAIPYSKMTTQTNSNTGAPSVREMVVSFDLAKVCHVTPQQYAIDMDYAGTSASNPSKQVYLLTGVHSVGSTTPVTCTVSIQITYDVEWFNPLPLQ